MVLAQFAQPIPLDLFLVRVDRLRFLEGGGSQSVSATSAIFFARRPGHASDTTDQLIREYGCRHVVHFRDRGAAVLDQLAQQPWQVLEDLPKSIAKHRLEEHLRAIAVQLQQQMKA